MTEIKVCFICSSDKFVDGHHYDCQYGKISPETVPLCRRCHTTYHIWGIGAFSPDTTERALEVENKLREILRSLPPDHPEYRRAAFLGILSPLKLEDVKRSRYWYKKHNITPPSPLERKRRKIPFRIPAGNPLCGEDWLKAHLADHTPEEIEALTIEVGYANRWQMPIPVSSRRGAVKKTVTILAEQE